MPRSGTTPSGDTVKPIERHASTSPPIVIHSARAHSRNTQLPGEERQHVGLLVGPLAHRLADAVTGTTLLVEQDRPLVLVDRDAALQQRGHLAGVERIDPGVALGRRQQNVAGYAVPSTTWWYGE